MKISKLLLSMLLMSNVLINSKSLFCAQPEPEHEQEAENNLQIVAIDINDMDALDAQLKNLRITHENDEQSECDSNQETKSNIGYITDENCISWALFATHHSLVNVLKEILEKYPFIPTIEYSFKNNSGKHITTNLLNYALMLNHKETIKILLPYYGRYLSNSENAAEIISSATSKEAMFIILNYLNVMNMLTQNVLDKSIFKILIKTANSEILGAVLDTGANPNCLIADPNETYTENHTFNNANKNRVENFALPLTPLYKAGLLFNKTQGSVKLSQCICILLDYGADPSKKVRTSRTVHFDQDWWRDIEALPLDASGHNRDFKNLLTDYQRQPKKPSWTPPPAGWCTIL